MLNFQIDDIRSDNHTKPNQDINLNEIVLKMNNDLRAYQVRNHTKLYITLTMDIIILDVKSANFRI